MDRVMRNEGFVFAVLNAYRFSEILRLWIAIAIVAAVDLVWLRAAGMTMAIDPTQAIAFCAAALLSFVYTRLRPDRRIAELATALAQIIAFTVVGAILSYLTITAKFPLVDSQLAGVDTLLRLNWLAFFEWVEVRPIIKAVLAVAYHSCMLQVAILLVWLSACGRFERMREFVWLFVTSLLVILPISWRLPAASAWVYFGVVERVDAYHLIDFNALRSGEMTRISLTHVNGLITFPSFHAALATILIYASRGMKMLFPLYLVLNLLMLAATPTVGGHYFIDIIAGAGIVLCLACLRQLRWGVLFARWNTSPSHAAG
ncbi:MULTISPECIES: phosphatase PAP2 family protein [Bradyrhizobium]|jgi:membrane-associated phospholipid phosphatase|uniref:phosphatase PAP2 family protein n=1 Tax=Bradyrhizobium TaxID=374 RepID=UPI00195814B9|nr:MULTISPECIES: phosphatase PAP2 family protein [Bradyrhizobium]MBM7481046.1 membrane-associated phospholipid phosphatase [Bradyrhizobium canariense]MCK1272771.1 phosphatase PAP2 family protein [Bradyrhizobium sp. 84]MCK1351404.1 phosphatase PAP2 family protein [Bradyrhizobium sp. CW7]MCK1372814.1 phosphatase PAP2 family protein [Bradyrhizobium sp. 49]MCK1418253.1 phosphatase PAP2 family protein [Bradyrhizobium sp. CW4]